MLFDVLVLMLFKLLTLIVYFISFPAQLAEFISPGHEINSVRE